MPRAQARILAALQVQRGIFGRLIQDAIPKVNVSRYPNLAGIHKPGVFFALR
jgi:hypothetical protein